MTGRGQWCNHATWYGPVCPFCIAAGEVARPAYRHPRRTRITLALYRRRQGRRMYRTASGYVAGPLGVLDHVTSRYGALQRTVGDVDNSRNGELLRMWRDEPEWLGRLQRAAIERLRAKMVRSDD